MDEKSKQNRYCIFLELLKETRLKAKVTQVELAERLGETQSFVSKLERGARRIDVIELEEICRALGTTLKNFSAQLERKLTTHAE